MMNEPELSRELIEVQGRVIQGHGVASGTGDDDRFPEGTIALQQPHFAERGLDLSHCYMGTLNISIEPMSFEMVQPQYTFDKVVWTDTFPAETFSLTPCEIHWDGQKYDCYIYYPHPETKPDHFQPPNMLEVIGPRIEGLAYGGEIILKVDSREIRIS